LDVRIHNPVKSDTSYVIDLTIVPDSDSPVTKRIGFVARNFSIPHLELWDTFLPLMWLTRNGGPLFGRDSVRATVRADFPLNADVVAFFEQRARDFGIVIDVTSRTIAMTYDVQTSGTSVLFGGGKDSRLLLGTLRELGENPSVVSARGSRYAADIEGALCFDPFDNAMPNRIVPALMLGAMDIYHGSGLGEIHITKPWHRYYDISAAAPVGQTNELLRRLGVDVTVHVPQCVLPYNIVQLILARRYPDLFKGQISVEPNKRSQKNLHVALLKRYHDLPHQDHCSDQLLTEMAQDFVVRSADDVFGYRRNREIIQREMRAILVRLHRRGELVHLNVAPPAEWDAPWIDCIHSYCNPGLDPRLMAIYREYAEEWRGDPQLLPLPLRRYFQANGPDDAANAQTATPES
jgi:hypothetical protein